MSTHAVTAAPRGMGVLRTQLTGVLRRPTRLLLTGLAVLVASFVVFATLLSQQIAERTLLNNASGTPAAVDLVVGRTGTISTDNLTKVRAVPGVAEAVGRVSIGATVGAGYLTIEADPGKGELATTTLTQGRYPAGPTEIAVTARTAERMGLTVGTVTSLTAGEAAKPRKVTVTGLVAASHDFGGTGYTTQAAVTAISGDKGLQQIDVHLKPGASIAEVRAAVDATLGPPGEERAQVLTGAQTRTAEAEETVSELSTLFAVIGMFVAIAVVAAGLVATSTFRIVFAQRMRQLALLRTVGAGRGKITRALAAEGAITGFVAGTVGVLAALLLGHALPPILRIFDIEVSNPGFPARSALAVVALAVLITSVAVLAPAFAASKVAPLEALRAASTTAGRRDIGKLRWVVGLLLTAGAIAIAALIAANLPGPDAKDYDPTPMLMGVVLSGALAFFALVSLGPVLVRPVLRAVGWPLRQFGPVGRLAVGGIGGAPRRAAAVSVVVALGVTLIAGVIVSGASVRVLAERELAMSVPADYEMTAGTDAAIPADVVERARKRPELTHVVPYRRVDKLTISGSDTVFDANDLAMKLLPTLDKIDATSGSLADLGPGKVVLSSFVAEQSKLAVGDTATLSLGGRTAKVTIAAILPSATPLYSSLTADPADLDLLGVPAGADGLLADAAATGEQARTAGQRALREVTDGTPGLGIDVLADQRDELNTALNVVLGIAVALIGLTVIIAVVGVGTTTALSVVERIRESGLLRAVGLSRGGLRAMLTAEAGLYGVIGATIGLALGIPYAWLSVEALGLNAPLQLPVPQIAAVFVVLVALTALAGVLPARRASRVSPVSALATDG
jgi:putative ABC transport system permease protein